MLRTLDQCLRTAIPPLRLGWGEAFGTNKPYIRLGRITLLIHSPGLGVKGFVSGKTDVDILSFRYS